jgi:ribosomal protein S1
MKDEAGEDLNRNTEAKEDWAARKEMEALFAQEEGVAKKLSAHEIVWANVIAVNSEAVLVDIGEKREGFIPVSDFSVAVPLSLPTVRGRHAAHPDLKTSHLESSKLAMPQKNSKTKELRAGVKSGPRVPELPKLGERIPVIYVGRRSDGASLLSHRKAKADISWGNILKSFQEKNRVFGKVQSLIKGGFLVDISGVMAFMPGSLADMRPVFNGDGMIGKGVHCRIIELNESDRKIVVSRRAVLEEEMAERRVKVFEGIEPGQIRFGRISKTSLEGLIVDIGGLRGLIRSGDIAWGETSTPLYKRGDKLRVKVLSKAIQEANAGKPSEFAVYFGIKQLLSNPVEFLKKKYSTGVVVSGVVFAADTDGVAFKILKAKGGKDHQGSTSASKEKNTSGPAASVVAFCPASQTDPDSPCKEGDDVSGVVSGVDPKTFHVIVSIKRQSEKADRARVAQYLKAPRPLTLGDILSAEE